MNENQSIRCDLQKILDDIERWRKVIINELLFVMLFYTKNFKIFFFVSDAYYFDSP